MALQMICDECGENCDAVAYDILIRSLHNPSPISITDTSEPAATHDTTHIRAVLCQTCYHKHNMPNIYRSSKEGKLVFNNWSEPDQLPKAPKPNKKNGVKYYIGGYPVDGIWAVLPQSGNHTAEDAIKEASFNGINFIPKTEMPVDFQFRNYKGFIDTFENRAAINWHAKHHPSKK